MDEHHAKAVADALGGEAWQSGGGIWLVLIRRDDGRIVAISQDAVCLYADDESLDSARSVECIALQAGQGATLG